MTCSQCCPFAGTAGSLVTSTHIKWPLLYCCPQEELGASYAHRALLQLSGTDSHSVPQSLGLKPKTTKSFLSFLNVLPGDLGLPFPRMDTKWGHRKGRRNGRKEGKREGRGELLGHICCPGRVGGVLGVLPIPCVGRGLGKR